MKILTQIVMVMCFTLTVSQAEEYAGLSGSVGAGEGARVVERLLITEPGVYENIIVDGQWGDHDLVRIRCDDVVLKNCTIRYGQRDAVEVYGKNVRIENCLIHHVLAGSFLEQKDAHGITGRPLNLVIRNTEVHHVSGDAIQFDPGRKVEPWAWDNVLVENCFLWTGPLDADYARFKKGERPGENAFDSKVNESLGVRARITFRNCLMQGWGHGQINNGAAMNFKEKIQAVVDNCVFVENDIGFRCRGSRGGAWVTVRNSAIYTTTRPFRLEHGVKNIRVFHLALGKGNGEMWEHASGGAGDGFVSMGERDAPPLAKWPYKRLAVGNVIEKGNPAESADEVLPTKLATGTSGP